MKFLILIFLVVFLVSCQSLKSGLKPWSRHDLISRLEIYDMQTGKRRVVYTDTTRFEAPNWSRDGSYLLFNREGRIFRIPVKGGKPVMIPTGFADCCNNDHGISPDGTQLVISHNLECNGAKSMIYVLPIAGGEPRQVTTEYPSYWHGWSPDGRTLAYVARRGGDFDIYTIPVEGGEETRLTFSPGLDDGPDYSPDGRVIYFNSMRSGRMQLWQMAFDGSSAEQLTNDSYNNWFPHPDPSGRYLVYIAYVEEVEPHLHPADKQVMLRLFDLQTRQIRDLVPLTGGQGTINVPSWSPDGRYFAFVSYEVNGKTQ